MTGWSAAQAHHRFAARRKVVKMNFRQWLLACSIPLASLSAGAQMPAPAPADSAAAQADAARQLEALLLCKAGTNFKAQAMQARFQALGLVKNDGGIFLPKNGAKVSIFGDEVLAASVYEELGENKLSVYLKNQTGKQVAKKLGVNKIDEEADTDEPSYYKQTSKKTTLLVFSAAELDVGNSGKSINFNSAVICQVIQ